MLYIDESGDNGFKIDEKTGKLKGTDYFIIAGIVIDAQNWKEVFWKILNLKININKKFGIKINEFKGADLFKHRGDFFNKRLTHSDTKWIHEKFVNIISSPLLQKFVLVRNKYNFIKKNPKVLPANYIKTKGFGHNARSLYF